MKELLNAVAAANKAKTVLDCKILQIYLNLIYRSGTSSLLCLDENRETSPQGLLFIPRFIPFSPFYEEFNEKIIQMHSAGLTKYWYQDKFRRLGVRFGVKMKPVDIGSQVLTMEHLEVPFIACLIPMVTSILAFIIEVSILMFKKYAQKYLLCGIRELTKNV